MLKIAFSYCVATGGIVFHKDILFKLHETTVFNKRINPIDISGQGHRHMLVCMLMLHFVLPVFVYFHGFSPILVSRDKYVRGANVTVSTSPSACVCEKNFYLSQNFLTRNNIAFIIAHVCFLWQDLSHCTIIFMPPAWKVCLGRLVFGSPVRLFVRNSVPLINKVQYLKFHWSYSDRTWTVSSSKGCSHFTDITCPWGMGWGQNVGLRDICNSLTLLPPGASVFHKHMSS